MAKDHVGHVSCPCCAEDAEVREQKNGRAYVLCTSPLCGFQGFTRSDGADQSLRGRMKPKLNITPPAAAPGQGTGSAPETKPADNPKKGFFDGIL
ncbi:hypothetical protein [uncultured Dechloromonas sp.]|uniref:hypothetical protein n=1 Tax=uncultured Dechloromonas sp. TaxID=171719 RepID=UPI0025DFC80E|nr:hypothetical protein [uncultured Dechloromonas sp.]